MGSEGRASVFYIKLDNPANIDAVIKSIQERPGMEKYRSARCRNICR